MGSSAASAAAGAWAVNALFGAPITKQELILPGLTSEATVSGYHADNIAPAILGGFVLIRRGTILSCRIRALKATRAAMLINDLQSDSTAAGVASRWTYSSYDFRETYTSCW